MLGLDFINGLIGVERFLVLKFGVEDDITGIVDAAAVQPDFEFGQPPECDRSVPQSGS